MVERRGPSEGWVRSFAASRAKDVAVLMDATQINTMEHLGLMPGVCWLKKAEVLAAFGYTGHWGLLHLPVNSMR